MLRAGLGNKEFRNFDVSLILIVVRLVELPAFYIHIQSESCNVNSSRVNRYFNDTKEMSEEQITWHEEAYILLADQFFSRPYISRKSSTCAQFCT